MESRADFQHRSGLWPHPRALLLPLRQRRLHQGPGMPNFTSKLLGTCHSIFSSSIRVDGSARDWITAIILNISVKGGQSWLSNSRMTHLGGSFPLKRTMPMGSMRNKGDWIWVMNNPTCRGRLWDVRVMNYPYSVRIRWKNILSLQTDIFA